MDHPTQVVLDWINLRRAWLGRPELADLEPPDEDHPDPVTASLGAQWVLGCLQTSDVSRIYQYDKAPCIKNFLALWHSGAYPQYHERTPSDH